MRSKDFDREKFILEEWPEALESGEFKQGKGRLLSEEDNLYCCLGVACELLSRKKLLSRKSWKYNFLLPTKAQKLLGVLSQGEFAVSKYESTTLANVNDSGKSFKIIARKIRSIEKSRKWAV